MILIPPSVDCGIRVGDCNGGLTIWQKSPLEDSRADRTEAPQRCRLSPTVLLPNLSYILGLHLLQFYLCASTPFTVTWRSLTWTLQRNPPTSVSKPPLIGLSFHNVEVRINDNHLSLPDKPFFGACLGECGQWLESRTLDSCGVRAVTVNWEGRHSKICVPWKTSW